MARKKADPTAETDVTVRASPETQLTIEATSPTKGGSAAGGAATVLQAIRDNPVPAGMIWAGLGWMVLSAAGARRPQVDGAQQAVAGVASTTQETVSQVATGVQDRARSLVGRTRGAVGASRMVVMGTASTARERATAGALRARDTVQRLTTEKPEVLELAAAAAGAAVALALPATEPERQLVSPRRDEILEKLDEVAMQAVEKVEQVVEPPQQPSPQ